MHSPSGKSGQGSAQYEKGHEANECQADDNSEPKEGGPTEIAPTPVAFAEGPYQLHNEANQR